MVSETLMTMSLVPLLSGGAASPYTSENQTTRRLLGSRLGWGGGGVCLKYDYLQPEQADLAGDLL